MPDYNIIIPHYSVILAEGLKTIIQDRYQFKNQISMELLSATMNDIYQVISGEYEYTVRIPRHERFWPYSIEQYRFEMNYINYLRSKNLNVAYPIPTKEKKFLGILNAPEGIRYHSMHTSLQGKIPDTSNSNEMYLVGKYLARMHSIAENYQTSRSGIEWDFDLLIRVAMDKLRSKVEKDLDKEIQWLETKAQSLQQEFHKYITDKTKSNWGIIHGAFKPAHLRIDGENVGALNFEYCGYGFKIMDLVFLLQQTNINNIATKSFQACLEGYKEVRKLSDEELKALPILAKLMLISQTTVSAGMINLVGKIWFDEKIRNDLQLLRKVL